MRGDGAKMQAYEGYFENGRFYTAGKAINIPERKRVFITILDEPARETRSQKQLSAFRRFIETNKTISNEPIDEEFDEILARGISMREIDI